MIRAIKRLYYKLKQLLAKHPKYPCYQHKDREAVIFFAYASKTNPWGVRTCEECKEEFLSKLGKMEQHGLIIMKPDDPHAMPFLTA